MPIDLSCEKLDIEAAADEALGNADLLSSLIDGIHSKEDRIRFNSFKVLLFISEKHPEKLYPHWDIFVDLIHTDNAYLKYIAIYLIASLASVDTEDRFEKIFDVFYGMLDDRSVIPPAHLAVNSVKIVKAKPDLAGRITARLLDIDKTHHRPDRKELIKAFVIEAFDEFFEGSREKESIMRFVSAGLASSSPKTRNAAEKFMEKHTESDS